MKYEKLGTTDIGVSKICYCRMIAQAGHLNEHQQIQQSNMTYDAKNKEGYKVSLIYFKPSLHGCCGFLL